MAVLHDPRLQLLRAHRLFRQMPEQNGSVFYGEGVYGPFSYMFFAHSPFDDFGCRHAPVRKLAGRDCRILNLIRGYAFRG